MPPGRPKAKSSPLGGSKQAQVCAAWGHPLSPGSPTRVHYNAGYPHNHGGRPFSKPMNDTHSPYKSKGGPRRLAGALRYSLQGLGAAFKHEAAFRQELLAAVVLIPLAFWLGNTLVEQALLIAAVFLVLIVEVLNSALEALADAITLEQHPLIGRAKDLGSAAVMLSIALACIVWLAVIVHHAAA